MATRDFISEVMNGILDSLGLDENNRQRRMRCRKACQILHAWHFESVNNEAVSPLYAGSRYETTTIDGLSSDVDTLMVFTNIRVIQNIHQWLCGDNRITYMMDEADCYPSYVKLYEVSQLYPGLQYSDGIPTTDDCVVDEDGKILLSSKLFIEKNFGGSTNSGFSESHGPALRYPEFQLEIDSVCAFSCDFFPRSALRWKERQTSETLPRVGESIVNEANYCHVVPVGNKLSPNESLEWRYSFAHIERQLVHSWNNVQYKLYVIMKFIIKDLIEPQVPDVLSSYHMKTILFWMNEEFKSEFFVPSNINQCLLRYLNNVADTVRHVSLPHYFIEGCNLYYNKMDDKQSRQLYPIIKGIIDTWPCRLFDIKRRDLGRILQEVISEAIPLQVMSDRFHNERRAKEEFEMPEELSLLFQLTTAAKRDLETRNILEVEGLLKYLDQRSLVGISDVEITDVINFIRNDIFCSCSVNSLVKHSLYPEGINTSDVVMASSCIQRHSNCGIDTRLKIAAYLVKTGDFREGVVLLDQIERQIKPYTLHICGHPSCEHINHISHLNAVHDNKPTMLEYFKHYTANVVEYQPEMMGHLPKPLVYEMFRSMSVLHRSSINEWHKHAVIQSPVFMYLLRYTITQARGQYAESKVAVDNMMKTSAQPQIFGGSHSETNLNVIGHCHMELGDTEGAFREFKKSLNIQNKDNAAIWHIAVLLWRKVHEEMSV